MIDLILFYNISGVLICILSVIMFSIPAQTDGEGKPFNLSKNGLAILFLLTGVSMFTAQFEEQLPHQQFEKLNALMLLFFFLIGQGILFSILTLYVSRYADKKYLRRALWPVLPWCGLYTLIYFFTGDVRIYSFDEFFRRLPYEPLLILRCVILLSITISIIYSIRLCHRAKSEYHQLILNYFSETDFSRSVWLANLLGCGEALAVWVVLTYFYTNPIIEVIVGILIIIIFSFYAKEFHYYSRRYGSIRPAILLSDNNNPAADVPSQENNSVVPVSASEVETTNEIQQVEDKLCAQLLETWVKREDKPFVKQGLTIGDVANEIGIPKYRLSYYINHEQENFNAWIKGLRIEEASRLLLEQPQISVSTIADRIGFCDLPAFSRAFKKVKGVTPTEFKNRKLQ